MIGDCEKDPTIFRKFARRLDWWLDRIEKYGVKDDEAALMLAEPQTGDEITDELEDFNLTALSSANKFYTPNQDHAQI